MSSLLSYTSVDRAVISGMKRYAETLLESFGQRSVFVQKVCGAKTGLSHTSATVAAPWACGGNSGVFVECGGRDIDILTDHVWVIDEHADSGALIHGSQTQVVCASTRWD
jgi:hypothetical protein